MVALKEFTSGQESNTTFTPLEYMLFKSVEAGYMIEFLKNPLPWDKKVDLPYCGFTRSPKKRDTTPADEQLLKRSPQFEGLKKTFQDLHEVLTPPVVDKFNEELGKLLEAGKASVGEFNPASYQAACETISRTNNHRYTRHEQAASQGSPATIVPAIEHYGPHPFHCILDKHDHLGSCEPRCFAGAG